MKGWEMRNGLGRQTLPEAVRISASPHPLIPPSPIPLLHSTELMRR